MEFNLIQYILMTLVLFGWCSFQLGKAMANSWQSVLLMIFYITLLTCFERFLMFALFNQELSSFIKFFIDFISLLLISIMAFKITRTSYMVSQYPWKFKKKSIFQYVPK